MRLITNEGAGLRGWWALLERAGGGRRCRLRGGWLGQAEEAGHVLRVGVQGPGGARRSPVPARSARPGRRAGPRCRPRARRPGRTSRTCRPGRSPVRAGPAPSRGTASRAAAGRTRPAAGAAGARVPARRPGRSIRLAGQPDQAIFALIQLGAMAWPAPGGRRAAAARPISPGPVRWRGRGRPGNGGPARPARHRGQPQRAARPASPGPARRRAACRSWARAQKCPATTPGR